MPDPLEPYRRLCTSPADAMRWACILEASAPKVGNVHPGRSFKDLACTDFLEAAEITCQNFRNRGMRISQRMRDSVLETRAQLGTNVNLGIVLLLGPLVAADERQMTLTKTSERTVCTNRLEDWIPLTSTCLAELDEFDGANIFEAIRSATPGGMGSSDKLDINKRHDRVNILEAMHLAADRDQIARQYCDSFRELILEITPVISDAFENTHDVLSGLCHAQIHLLSQTPDSLIARKNGLRVAGEVQRRAGLVDPDDQKSVSEFDLYLRSEDHQLNPGTTADLIAASVYLLLRTHPSEKKNHE